MIDCEDTKRKIEVMQAFVDGRKIEVQFNGVGQIQIWDVGVEPVWNWEKHDFRIASVPDSIDWSHVSKNFNYMARDKNGSVWLYEQEPVGDAENWTISYGNYMKAEVLSSLTIGDRPWNKSLVERPLCA